jgi:hypothetical protein
VIVAMNLSVLYEIRTFFNCSETVSILKNELVTQFFTTPCLETVVSLIMVDSHCQIVRLKYSLGSYYHKLSNSDHVFLRHFIRRHS